MLETQANINAVQELPADSLTIESATADKGYHAVPEIGFLQQEGIRIVISDPVRHRNMDKLTPEETKVVRYARRSAKSQSGKDLLKRRGLHRERPCAHILDAGRGAADHPPGTGQPQQAFQVFGGHL